jgi:hypothetical protein
MRAKEHQMTSNTGPGPRILGSLQSAAGKGIVHIEDRFETDIDDLWSALTEQSGPKADPVPSSQLRSPGRCRIDLRGFAARRSGPGPDPERHRLRFFRP